MNELQAFRSQVEAYLRQHNVSATRFGREVANDGSFVFQLRQGREPRFALREKVRAHIEAADRFEIAS